MDERGDDCPEKYQHSTDCWNSAEDRVDHLRDNVKKQPRTTKDDRLHGIKTDKAVPLFENVKNDAPDEWNAGNGCSHVRRQTGRLRCRARPGFRTRRRRRWLTRFGWIGHDLHTQTRTWLVKQSCACER